MSTSGPTDLSDRVFARVVVSFPVSESPYCDLAASLGAIEIDVLSAVLELRECGRVDRIAAEFADFDAFVAAAAAGRRRPRDPREHRPADGRASLR